MFKTILTLCVLVTSVEAFAWGKTGHRIVGEIAQKNLSLDAQKGVQSILGNETLAKVATWADEIKSNRRYDYASPWHYVNFPYGKTYFEVKKNPEGDVLEAIIRMDETLRNKRATNTEKQEALKFLVHFVGDVHQPLHVGQASDRGGNSVTVLWFEEPTNLHHVWDDSILRFEEFSYTEYVNHLNQFTNEQRVAINSGTPLDWAMETRSYAEIVYNVGTDKKLGYDYQAKAKLVVEERLRSGGLRLAKILNDIFENKPHKKEYNDLVLKIKAMP